MKKNAVFTEADAVKRLCPTTLAATVVAGEANYYPAVCQASQCMAWRWHTTHVNNPAIPGTLIEAHDVYGFCGLAGAP